MDIKLNRDIIISEISNEIQPKDKVVSVSQDAGEIFVNMGVADEVLKPKKVSEPKVKTEKVDTKVAKKTSKPKK